MKLRDLNPRFSRIYKDFDPLTGGTPTEDFTLEFNCPACGSPYSVAIKFGLGAPDESVGRWNSNILPGALDFLDHLTISPSIGNTKVGHGPRHPTCTFHGSIVNGEVVP